MPALVESNAILLGLVNSGYFIIDKDGKIWRADGSSAEHRLPQGYMQVRAMIKEKRYVTGSHRLVYQSIHGLLPADIVVNHINGKKDDNRPQNLESCTPGENLSHAHRMGLLIQSGERNHQCKLTSAQIEEIRTAYATGNKFQHQLADQYGVSHQTISKIVRGDRRLTEGGPHSTKNRKYTADRDPKTMRFTKAAGRLLDGQEHLEVPTI